MKRKMTEVLKSLKKEVKQKIFHDHIPEIFDFLILPSVFGREASYKTCPVSSISQFKAAESLSITLAY